jgi:alanyl-tRNA synthetase
MESMLQSAAGAFKIPAAELPAKIEQLLDSARVAERELARLKSRLASSQGDDLLARAVDVKGLKVLAALLDGADARVLRETLDRLKDKLKPAAIVLATITDGKVQLAAGVSADAVGRIKAGDLVNFVAQQVGGKGGGKPDMAMAGGTDPSALPKALASVHGWVADRT